ncbi:glycerate kinase [Chitinibacter fontanus]|uniref:Glycerate kinase n=1 Tax=Chitinibacter fontanus TaxID=1737446 RepID=A0A7D5Z5F4_9NEIS|nr:glycerate kinase [Chitinibacter fontanus]QLI81323.1 glycerate kinase [Chitinibacter fontanus]
MKKIVIAPDSFKESLSAKWVVQIIANAMAEILPDVQLIGVPLADGGEGTAATLVDATAGQLQQTIVRNPLGNLIHASWGLLGDRQTAVIEMATASGLALIPPAQRNPCLTSSAGTGDLLKAALDAGARRFILALGGSATNDGGAGMLQALGVGLLDCDGQPIIPGGAALAQLARIDLTDIDSRLADCEFEIACDVDNPLIGQRGAAAVFGPQKGATTEMVAILDAALAHYAAVIQAQLGKAVSALPGAGAAGGMGAAALAFLPNVCMRRGVDIVLQATQLEQHLADADLVITGEGCLDAQTILGKVPIGVAQLAKRYAVPVIAIGGCVRADVAAVYAHGIDAVFSCVPAAMPLESALANAEQHLAHTARNVAAVIRLLQK